MPGAHIESEWLSGRYRFKYKISSCICNYTNYSVGLMISIKICIITHRIIYKGNVLCQRDFGLALPIDKAMYVVHSLPNGPSKSENVLRFAQ